ncbi:hypothetical protein [Brevibacterium sp. CSND-B09]|uniref:hypothetical protein n=1 Tax=Brevibacterium sp. CSND-B09 TaxID=3462571 RepID=UPI00406A3D5F
MTLTAAVALAVAAGLTAAFGFWVATAIAIGLWLAVVPLLIHLQTRIVNAGTRAMRDSLARRNVAAVDDAALISRLDALTQDLAVLRATAAAEPTQNEVQADLIQLAHTLRREVRLLQYAISIADESSVSDEPSDGASGEYRAIPAQQ